MRHQKPQRQMMSAGRPPGGGATEGRKTIGHVRFSGIGLRGSGYNSTVFWGQRYVPAEDRKSHSAGNSENKGGDQVCLRTDLP